MEDADIYRQLARGLHLRLSTNRRSSADLGHWWFLLTLYQFVDQPSHLAEDVWAATERYPWNGELTAETRVFAVSHRLRTKINQAMNDLFIRPRLGAMLIRASGEPVPHTLNQPQDMWVIPGQILQGCSQINLTILNGVHYEVKEVPPHVITVQMTERYRKPEDKCDWKEKKQQSLIVLSHRDASASLRLLHCTTYRSAQGCTIPKHIPVLMMDASHKYFDHRTLIVGLSRVEHGSQLGIATHEQQQQTFGWCGRAARKPLDSTAPRNDGAPLGSSSPKMAYREPTSEDEEDSEEEEDQPYREEQCSGSEDE